MQNQHYTYRPSKILYGILKIVLFSYIGVLLISVITDINAIIFWGFYIKTSDFSETFNSIVNFGDLFSGILLSTTLWTSIVIFLIWINRANKNARALGAKDIEYSPGWTVGWFFVPIMNLFKPYQAVEQIWRASQTDRSKPWEQNHSPLYFKFWWVFWVISNIIAYILARMSLTFLFNNNVNPQFELATSTGNLIADLFDIPLTLLFISVISSIYKSQEKKYQLSQGLSPEQWTHSRI
ncbi:MAG: DUF4328 domain-containing protein [Deltaproteobacteria bacterium]|nr:DUF4328 domain-containing protein [Deltaproteobacteria bacterium]